MFQFKQFSICQDRCAMKVGTDGVLLGAWARGGHRVLDIGTGTGVIALMMAQRFVGAEVLGIDIDAVAVAQASENAMASPFASRVSMLQADVCTFQSAMPFDSIVCNPPFFIDSLPSPDARRSIARHTDTLSYRQLMQNSWRLLADEGQLSVVIPFDCRERLESEAFIVGFFKTREVAVKTTPRKAPRRYLLAFSKHSADFEKSEGVIEDVPGHRSLWYETLTGDFYCSA